VAAQKALAARARAEGAVRDEEPAKTEPGAEPGEPRDEASNETAPKAPEVTKQEAIRAAGEQTTPPRNRRVATTDDAAFDASDRSSAPKPSRNSKPKVVIAAAAMLGVAGLWAALQSSGTKSSREAESVAVSKAVTQAAPAKAPEPVNQQIAQPVQQAVPAMEPPQPPAPAPQPVSAELPAQPERAAAAATQAPAPEEPTSGGPTTRVVIRSKTKGAKFYRYGKEVGTDEITVDLPVGEKRAFELGLPGHATRKVVVDGSSTVIELGLRKIEGKPGSHTPSDL
jgi:hypothetical protein